MSIEMEHVALSLDVVSFAVMNDRLCVLLMRRNDEPFAGEWALPGGVVRKNERLNDAASRLLAERTGMNNSYLEQLYTFGDPDRDPRGRTVSVAYYTLLPLGQHPVKAGRGATTVAWHAVDALPPLAFDHTDIVAYARQRLEQKISYAPLLFHVLPETFTMGDLRVIHEAIVNQSLHPSNFVRQMLARWDLAPVSGIRDRRTRRPARLYRYIGPRDIPGPPSRPARQPAVGSGP